MKRILLSFGLCLLMAGMSYGQTSTNVLRGGVVINEFLADPNGSENFDTDGNGTAETTDEYVEIFNTSSSSISLNGLQIWDAGNDNWFTFPDTSLAPGRFAFVIVQVQSGGSLPTLSGGNMAFDANTGSTINNGGDNIVLYDPTADTFIQIRYNGDAEDDPVATYDSFSATASRVGTTDDFGTETDGVATTRYPDGDDNTISHTDNYSANASPGTSPLLQQITGSAGWRMLSFPFSGGAAEDISDDTAIQGVSGGDNTGSTSNFMTYDSDGAFETPASVSTDLGNGYGFITFFYNNTTEGSSELPLTLDVSGTEPSSDVSVGLNVSTTESSNYFTMVGNPYASNFDLSSITATGGSIQNNVAFWDDNANSYSSQDRTTPYIVAPWQGFWVETTSSSVTAISMPTSGKTTTAATGTFFAKENPNSGDINFTLSSENTFDKAIRLSARPNAVLGYDLDDASKFTPLLKSYATMAFVGSIDNEDKLQSVFSVPSNLEDEVSIPLRVNADGASGEFTFAWENLESISDNWEVLLTDHENGTSVSLREVNSYTFVIDAPNEKSNRTILNIATAMESDDATNNRFSITLSPNTSVSNEPGTTPTEFALNQNYPNPFNPTTTISYSVGQAGPVNITVYNVMGQKVAELVNSTKNAGNNYQVTWNATAQASGIYYYRLTAPGQVLTRQMTLIK